MTDICFFGKRPLAIAAMEAELPPFNNEEHKSESAFTLDRGITPLTNSLRENLLFLRFGEFVHVLLGDIHMTGGTSQRGLASTCKHMHGLY